MIDFKNIFASKTIWGAVLMILPVILGLFGFSSEDAAAVGTQVTSFVEHAIQFVGFVLTVWGRLTATKGIKLT